MPVATSRGIVVGRASIVGVITDAAVCPFEVERPVMMQRWDTLTFLHWSFAPDTVQRLLPASLTVETFDGRAWVGLVPFFMYVSLPHTRSIPWASRFCETNVRTYVRDASGRSGIWFFSLDAARFGAVVTARTTYHLPYFWSRMRCVRSGTTIEYTCDRRWPGPTAASRVIVDVGEPYRADELTAFDHFLTARWIVFSAHRGRTRHARAQHTPWPLQRATARRCEDGLMRAARSAAGRRRAPRALLARRRRPDRPARVMTGLAALVLDDGDAIGVQVTGARQAGESFEKARLVDVELVRCDLSGCNFSEAVWQRVRLVDCRCSGIELPQTSLRNVTFAGCKLDDANLRLSKLQDVRFDDSVLVAAELIGARLENVSFRGSDLRGADLSNVRCAAVDLRDTRLDGLKGINVARRRDDRRRSVAHPGARARARARHHDRERRRKRCGQRRNLNGSPCRSRLRSARAVREPARPPMAQAAGLHRRPRGGPRLRPRAGDHRNQPELPERGEADGRRSRRRRVGRFGEGQRPLHRVDAHLLGLGGHDRCRSPESSRQPPSSCSATR